MNPKPNPNTMNYKKLHEHILQEHDLFLFEDELKEIVRIVLKITDNKPDIIKDQKGGQHLFPVFDDYPLFEHMDKEYGITLLESQMREIIDIVLEMHNEKPENCTESIERQYKEKGNQLGEVYWPMKEEIEIATELATSINGWQRVKIDFTVEVKPRWWQFWKPRIDAQDFQWSAWLKPKGEAFLYQPQIEKK